ncbi:Iron-uptake factor PiuC [hydrothermal vent metagenome]|uniref:Iron-uptake factor PiuC n=1 Tax=hydrothermal vent metagenome TaxID=652676 RepID=A0A3B0YP74_9ZZZZ
MLLVIPGVLDSQKLSQVRSLLKQGRFIDGRLSAGKTAKRVKHNEELHSDASQMEQLNGLVMASLVQHPLYQAAAMPYRVASPYYARYTGGMSYGDHVDDPVMGPPGGQYRSDISTTVFLNEPDEYAGGELVIRTRFGEQSLKPVAGNAVIYPSSSLHHINEVTSGERLVAVTWTQSMLRDPDKRELVFQLYQARESLLETQPDSDVSTQVDHAYVNLMRMWSEL